MKTRPHGLVAILAITLTLLAFASSVCAQTNEATPLGNSTGTSSQSASEGIQKRWNEWGVWGGISFDAPTVFGTTPSARYGHIGLRYGRVLAASKTVAFEWTIDAVPL